MLLIKIMGIIANSAANWMPCWGSNAFVPDRRSSLAQLDSFPFVCFGSRFDPVPTILFYKAWQVRLNAFNQYDGNYCESSSLAIWNVFYENDYGVQLYKYKG
jgi:hypothetical protein